MNTKEAIHQMIDGKKARRKHWKTSEYVQFTGTEFITSEGYSMLKPFDEADNWEIYEEPKPKVVVIEKWLCKSSWDTFFIQEAEPSYFKGSGYNFNQVKLLSTREVEID